MRRVEIITAVRDEEASLPPFVERVRALALPDGVTLSLVFVEDSSTDGTLERLRALAAQDPRIAYYRLEQGFGQGPAIVFGMARSSADAMILMDVDGSHPPEVIPEMIARHLEGASVVQCVRRTLRNRRLYRRIATALFQRFASWLANFDLAEQSIYYRLVSREVAREIVAEPRYWRFLRLPLPTTPGAVARIEIDTIERTHDESKYGLLRLMGLAVDAVLSLMPVGRFRAGIALGAITAAAAIWLGGWPLGIVIGMALVWTLRRHRALRSDDLLTRMRVAESANAPLEPAFR